MYDQASEPKSSNLVRIQEHKRVMSRWQVANTWHGFKANLQSCWGLCRRLKPVKGFFCIISQLWVMEVEMRIANQMAWCPDQSNGQIIPCGVSWKCPCILITTTKDAHQVVKSTPIVCIYKILFACMSPVWVLHYATVTCIFRCMILSFCQN